MATAEDIERYKKIPPELRTKEQNKLAALIPFKKGQSGNPKGRPKGTPQWSTRIKRLMNDEAFFKAIVKTTPKNWKGLVGENSAEMIAAALIINATKVMGQALTSDTPINKDTRELIALLNKMGYGEKIVHDIEEDSAFDRKVFNFQVVSPDKIEGNTKENGES